jgi:hypothetical protein
MQDVRDRYGPLPLALLNLADYGRIRVLADGIGVESVDRDGPLVVFRFREKARLDPARLVRLVRERGDLQLVPPSSLKQDLRKPLQPKAAKAMSREPKAPGWWTARATAGEVRPGFSKAEILKPAREDPRASGGLLERVTGILEDLRIT